MNAVADPHQAFHRGTAGMFAVLTPDQIRSLAALEADSTFADRVAYLGERANEGEVTDSERAEYEAYIEANNLVAILNGRSPISFERRRKLTWTGLSAGRFSYDFLERRAHVFSRDLSPSH